MPIVKASKKGSRCHDVRIETPRLQAGKTEGTLGKAHRQSLRKQLWRRICPSDRLKGENRMRYQLKPIFCRPWLLNGLSTRLIESHYENIYNETLRHLNAITEKLKSLDFTKTPNYVINGLKRKEVIALNSTLLHELYFASLGVAPVAKGRNIPRPAKALAKALARDFGSFERWRDEFAAIGNTLAGSSGWVLLV